MKELHMFMSITQTTSQTLHYTLSCIYPFIQFLWWDSNQVSGIYPLYPDNPAHKQSPRLNTCMLIFCCCYCSSSHKKKSTDPEWTLLSFNKSIHPCNINPYQNIKHCNMRKFCYTPFPVKACPYLSEAIIILIIPSLITYTALKFHIHGDI